MYHNSNQKVHHSQSFANSDWKLIMKQYKSKFVFITMPVYSVRVVNTKFQE